MPKYGVTFNDVEIISADMVHVRGARPSVCMCTTTMKAVNDQIGSLRFSIDDADAMVFDDSMVRNAYAEAPDATGGVRMRLEIVDRRWKWATKRVSGRFNTRNISGQTNEESQKSWQELFEHVLLAAGEEDGSYTVTIPDDLTVAPEVIWDDEPVPDALEWLADKAGCVISLLITGGVLIEPAGSGPLYPWDEGQKVPVINFTKGAGEVSYAVRFAPTLYECWLRCVPVSIQRLDPVTILKLENMPQMYDVQLYAEMHFPSFYSKLDRYEEYQGSNRKYDYEGIHFRAYQIDGLVFDYKYGENTLPDGNTFSSIYDLLPIHDYVRSPWPNLRERQISGWEWWRDNYDPNDPENPNSRYFYRHRPWLDEVKPIYPIVAIDSVEPLFGVTRAYGGEQTSAPIPLDVSYTGRNRREYHLHDRFHLWHDHGVVFLNEPCVKVNEYNGKTEPGAVYLYCAFNARGDSSSGLHRYSYTEDTTAQDVVSVDDNAFVYWHEFRAFDDSLATNRDILREQAPAILESYKRASGVDLDTAWVEWTGIRPYDVRGNVWQMQWHVCQEGTYTRGGKNLEHPELTTKGQREVFHA